MSKEVIKRLLKKYYKSSVKFVEKLDREKCGSTFENDIKYYFDVTHECLIFEVTITKDNIHLYYEFMSHDDLVKYESIINVVLNSRIYEVEKLLNISFNSSDSNLDFSNRMLFIFETKDTLKPINEYIAEIKESSEYKEYIISNNKEAYKFCSNLTDNQDWSYLDARLETVVKFNIDEQLLNIMFDRAEYNREYISTK